MALWIDQANRAGSAYPRLPDPRYQSTAVWLDASDVKRR
jgi:hypothetical protein